MTERSLRLVEVETPTPQRATTSNLQSSIFYITKIHRAFKEQHETDMPTSFLAFSVRLVAL